MPAAVATASPQSPASNTPQRRQRFQLGATEHYEPGPEVTLVGYGQQAPNLEIPASGFLREIMLYVIGTTAANAATVVFAADAPYSAIGEITFLDTTGAPCINPVTGFELAMLCKWGGYKFDADPQRSQVYSVVPGAGGTGGSFAYQLYIPVEIVSRDAFGALGNQNSSAPFRVRLSTGLTTDIYTTPPTSAPSINIKTYISTWTVPPAMDPITGLPFNRFPDGHGTTQQWSKQQFNLAAAYQTVRYNQIGNLIRSWILITRNAAGARIDTAMPVSFELNMNGFQIYANFPTALLRQQMQNAFGYTTTQMDTGVYVWQFTDDLDGHPGGELKDQYLRTSTGTRIEFKGTFQAPAAAGLLTILTNDIRVPAGVGNVQG
jgi:hypothetical protein